MGSKWMSSTTVKAGFIVALLGAIGFIGSNVDAQRGQAQPQGLSTHKTLVVEEIRLVDTQGKTRARIASSPGDEGVNLILYHKDGRYATLYKLNPTGLPSMSLIQLP